MIIWALRIVGILTMLVCLVCVISYPGTVPEFKLAAGVGAGLILPALTCTMGFPTWILLELVLLACVWGAIHFAPPDIPGVVLLHLGWYPGALLGVMALLLLIFITQGWQAYAAARSRSNTIFGVFR